MLGTEREEARKERTMKIFEWACLSSYLFWWWCLSSSPDRKTFRSSAELPGRSVKKIRGRVEDDDVDAAPGKQTA